MGEIRVRIDAELAERLERISAQAGMSAEEVALAAILDHIEEVEDAPTARQRLKDVDEGARTPIAHDELVRRLGLED